MDRPLVLSSLTRLDARASAQPRPSGLAGGMSRPLLGQRHARLCSPRKQQQQQPACRGVCPAISCAYGRVTSLGSGSLGLPDDFNRHYLQGQALGAGAYGTVRFAWNREQGLECAVKVLPKVRGNAPASRTLRKLQREIQMHSRVQDCPGVATLFDVYEDESSVYMVLEYLRGVTLERYLLDNGPLSERETALVMYEVLKVIAACHAKGVLHGDVKPANWVFARPMEDEGLAAAAAATTKPWIKAVDFGCSQRWTGQPFATRVGTPVFMSPECFARDYGLVSDVWSAGIMMYQLFACRFPFWDTLDGCKTQTLDEVMHAVMFDDIAFDYGPWLGASAPAIELCARMLTRDPAQRITAAEALQHPWFAEQLACACQEGNNIVTFGGGAGGAAEAAPAAVPAELTRAK